MLILLFKPFKPFKVGDLIEAKGFIGHVREINVFIARTETPDSKTVIIPNRPLADGNITNLTQTGHLRVDLVVGISYGADIKQAREVLLTAMRGHPKVMVDPAPTEQSKLALDAAGIEIPFPQRVVHQARS